MAKARIRKAGGGSTRIVGPTLFTERLRPPAYDGDTERIYYEAWRLRSDGWIQSRIVRTWDPANPADKTEHSSAFTNWRRFKAGDAATHDNLRSILARIKGLDIVKESYR